jgi:hypothetical protein
MGSTSGIIDVVFTALGNGYPAELTAAILGTPSPPAVEALPRDLPQSARRCDSAARVADPAGAYVLHVEHFEGEPDLPRVFGYHAELHVRYRIPVLSAVFLTKPGTDAPRVYGFCAPGGPQTRMGLRIVRVWRTPARAVLKRGPRVLYPFAVLMRDPRPPEELILEVQRRIVEDARDERERADLLVAARALAGARLPEDTVRALFEKEADHMAKMQFLPEALREFRTRTLLRFLQARFGEIPQRIRTAVAAAWDVEEEEWERLVDLAAVAPDLKAFEEGLRRGGTS